MNAPTISADAAVFTVMSTAADTEPNDRAQRALVDAKRARLVASVAVAVSLNLAAIGVLAGVVSDWQSSPRKAPAHPRVTVVRALAAPTASTAARSIPVSSPPLPFPPPADATPAPAVPPAEAVPAPMAAGESDASQPNTQQGAAKQTADTDTLGAADHAVRFYRTAEVDHPAEPEGDSDWNLDTAALDSAGLHRLVFEVQVSRDGDIIDCTIVEPQPLARDIKLRLETRMRTGKLKPAMRQGVAVASTRKIELSVEGP